MLNLNCVICEELFDQVDKAYVTKCGHIFHHLCLCNWLNVSKTCPQCREYCDEGNIQRVYFNSGSLDACMMFDIRSLQEKLDSANLKVKVAEKELQQATEQIKNLNEEQKKHMGTIAGLEQKIKKKDLMAKEQNDKADALSNEVKRLKNQIETGSIESQEECLNEKVNQLKI